MAERVTDDTADTVDRGYDRAVELLGRDTADELAGDALEGVGVMERLRESGELRGMMEAGDFSALPSAVRPDDYEE